MSAAALSLLVFIVWQHFFNLAYTTRLPLEVYELTPSGVVAEMPVLKHKTLEYSTINRRNEQNVPMLRKPKHTRTIYTATKQPPLLSISRRKEFKIGDADNRSKPYTKDDIKSPQMLNILCMHHYDITFSGGHDGAIDPTAVFTIHTINPNSHRNNNLRILYQVGNAEDDLPICAANAVCSKIDLYNTPWLERQCRCPDKYESTELENHHNYYQHHFHKNSAAAVDQIRHLNYVNNDNYRNYVEHINCQQGKYLLFTKHNSEYKNVLDNERHRDDLEVLARNYNTFQHKRENSTFLNTAEPNIGRKANIHDHHHKLVSGTSGGDPKWHVHPNSAVHAQQLDIYLNNENQRNIPKIGGCPTGLGIEDGHTITDKTRHYKMCQPVHKLPLCRYFRDYTWSLTTSAQMNSTEQIVHCRCPKSSVTYLTKREPLDNNEVGYRYLFACSPVTRLRCQRKQPCKLFTVRKRQEFIDEVNINLLCQCPKGHHCPTHHTQSGILAGDTYLEENIQTYSGYCMAND